MSDSAFCCALSPARRRLINLFQQVNFGRIESLLIRDGEPVFDPPPRIVREVKFGGENGPRPESNRTDFQLKTQVIEIFSELDAIRDSMIDAIEVKHGLPFRMFLPGAVA
jgi:hypothetical protein